MAILPTYRPCSSVSEAAALLSDVVRTQAGGDENYYTTQLSRYLYSIHRIRELSPRPCRVLDIGSHYLHQSILLSLLGYEVSGVDVPVFTESPFIKQRALAMKISNTSSTGQESGDFLQGRHGTFQLIVCTEMLEHIAFNPVAFWRRAWELLSEDGMIYLTTPNAFRARQLVKSLFRLATFKGIGLPVDEILSVITYGHHWKEVQRTRNQTIFFPIVARLCCTDSLLFGLRRKRQSSFEISRIPTGVPNEHRGGD